MGIQVEFNPDLALRDYKEFLKGARKEDECIPERLISGKIYTFLKKGLRNYWLLGEIPLVRTQGNQQLSRPIASVKILEATHLLLNGEEYTKGKYQLITAFDEKDPKIRFENLNKIE
jgi:hypothetical protein